jgi:outer membrane protein
MNDRDPSPRRLRLRAGLLALLVVCWCGVARADIRIGYIDSARIFQEYKVAQEAQARFDRQVQDWRDEAAEKERSVNQLRAEVRDQGPILSALKRQEKEEGLQRAQADYERFIQEIWGPQGKATQENERSTAEVVGQIRTVVEKIATDKNMNLVLDSAGGHIVYADKNMDLTALVITELNERAAKGVTK